MSRSCFCGYFNILRSDSNVFNYLDFLLNVESCAKCFAGSVVQLHQEALQRLLVHGWEVGKLLHADPVLSEVTRANVTQPQSSSDLYRTRLLSVLASPYFCKPEPQGKLFFVRSWDFNNCWQYYDIDIFMIIFKRNLLSKKRTHNFEANSTFLWAANRDGTKL